MDILNLIENTVNQTGRETTSNRQNEYPAYLKNAIQNNDPLIVKNHFNHGYVWADSEALVGLE